MKKSNKGYTLVELLLSIAVFSIVMVAILTIMSNTLGAYSKANLDVAVQEDAQLVANQLEEIITDAQSIAGNATSGYVVNTKETVKQDDGSFATVNKQYKITYDGSNINVDLTQGGTSSSYVLARNVTDFSLLGWAPSADPSTTHYNGSADNETVIHLSMNNNGSSYNLNRAVYFRNNVETKAFRSMKYLAGSSSGGPTPTADVATLEVKRYEDINLTAEYGIAYGAKLYRYDGSNFVEDSTAATYFTLTKEKLFPGTTYTSGYNVESDTLPVVCMLTTATATNNNFGNPLGGNTYGVVGYTDSSKTQVKKVIFNVSAVSCSSNNVMQAHNGSNGTVNGEGFTCPITFEGINVNSALKKGVSVKTKAELKKGGSVATTFKQKTLGTTHYATGVINLGTYMNERDGSDQMEMGIAPDPYNGGMFVIFNNYGMQYVSDPGNLTLKCYITIGSQNFTPEFKLDRLDTNL